MTEQEQKEQFDRIASAAYLLSETTISDKSDLMIQIVMDEVLSYCNRDDIPKALERIISRIAANALTGDNEHKGNLTAYKEGDTSWAWDYSPENNAFNEVNLLANFRCIRSIGEDDKYILD